MNFTGTAERRLPGHVSFWIEYVEGESLLLWLSMSGVCAASGSACSSNIKGEDEEDLASSHVLTAIGVPPEICHGSICFSLGKESTEEEVDFVIGIMPGIVQPALGDVPALRGAAVGQSAARGILEGERDDEFHLFAAAAVSCPRPRIPDGGGPSTPCISRPSTVW